MFEGVYNNSRMLHFLTAVVVSGPLTARLRNVMHRLLEALFCFPLLFQGSTCDVKVKNGTTYEGIFKTLSSKVSVLKLACFLEFHGRKKRVK